jgi:hypothetical protein
MTSTTGAFSIFSLSRISWNTGVSKMPRRIHRPMPTSTIESANGTRQPQVTKSSPAQRLNAKMARFDNSKPHGTPNCGHDAINPRWFCVRDHSIASSTEPPHSPPTPMPWNTRRQDRAPDADGSVCRNEGDSESRKPHAEQCRDQCRFAPDAIAIMTEDRRADRTADKADEISTEGEQRRRKGILVGKIEFTKNQAGGGAVEKKVVPLDRRPHRRRDHCPAQLSIMFRFGQ